MARLLGVLAMMDCIAAAWCVVGGELERASELVARASRMLDARGAALVESEALLDCDWI